MKAKHLKPGDRFTVDRPDPESPIRVCLTNDEENGLRFGWPDNDHFWGYMGGEVEVQVAKKIKVRISDNVLDDEDWSIFELDLEPYKGGLVVMAQRAINLGAYGQDFIGFNLDRLSDWLCWDPTGQHPEEWHEIWIPIYGESCYKSGLSVDELQHLLEMV